MSWMGAYGLGMLGGLGSANYPNSFNSYMGAQQSSFSQEEAIRQYIIATQAQPMQQIQHQQIQRQQEVPKKPKPKFGSTIKALKDELQEETDKWLAGVLDA
ncbi:MAG: hypothetical protein ACREHG_06340 [Candidatus Saccharimonadales bacterium]